jgi:phage-related protein
MYWIYYYKDGNGRLPVREYIEMLSKKHDKDSRIKYKKITEYIFALSEYGLAMGEPQIKHIEGDIWELRPLRDRILFAAWDEEDQGFVLLHQFMKQTRKTPRREIDVARRRFREIKGDGTK